MTDFKVGDIFERHGEYIIITLINQNTGMILATGYYPHCGTTYRIFNQRRAFSNRVFGYRKLSDKESLVWKLKRN